MRDLDGSVSGYPGATLLPRQPNITLGFFAAPGCAAHPAYGLACPQSYFNLGESPPAHARAYSPCPVGLATTGAPISPPA